MMDCGQCIRSEPNPDYEEELKTYHEELKVFQGIDI